MTLFNQLSHRSNISEVAARWAILFKKESGKVGKKTNKKQSFTLVGLSE